MAVTAGADLLELAPNRPRQFYRGGARGADFRGMAAEDAYRPEDWLASTTTRFGRSRDGLTVLPGGRALRDAVSAEPEWWLGSAHVARFGTDTAMLVKLLDAAERLPVHLHPTRAAAGRHLGCVHGKTEAWVVLDTAGPGSRVWLGFRSDVAAEDLARWVASQDTPAMLGCLNEIAVGPGDTVLVPAGVPHAIGPGVLCLELQEPTDFSLNLEWAGFELEPGDRGQLGLPADLVLSMVDRRGIDASRLESLRSSRPSGVDGVEELFPAEAEPFFRATRVTVAGELEVPSSFSVVVVLSGDGTVEASSAGTAAVRRGSCILAPWAAGPLTFRAHRGGDLQAVVCRPPAPETPGEGHG